MIFFYWGNMSDIVQKIKFCYQTMDNIIKMLPIKQYQMRIDEIDETMSKDNIWNNPQKAASLMKERQKISDTLESSSKLNESAIMFMEIYNSSPNEINELNNEVESLFNDVSNFELSQMFKSDLDNNPAILTITAGAGGLEAANWVNMLLRMYCRYANERGFKNEILDMKPSEEHSAICIDSVTIRVEGKYAYGFLKNETGVHRLIRNSPFNSGDARHTSFAAVAVSADIEDIIDIKIEDKDLDISTMRASGSGGQNVNKVESAVRIKHIPSGIVINSRSDRDQHVNRRIAFKMLKSKLYELELKKREAEKEKALSSISDASFGSQIRTYTMSNYSLVKDHRSSFEDTNANKILDGDLHNIILSCLRVA